VRWLLNVAPLPRCCVPWFTVERSVVRDAFRTIFAQGDRIMSHEFEPLSGRIIEAALAVHKALGPRFLESIYHNALRVALSQSDLPYESQKEVRIHYEGVEVGVHYLDLVVGEQIVLELKAVKALEPVHFAQVRSYLSATGLHVGLLFNFNSSTLVVKPIVLG
jgi:GxxExxY protein